LCGETTRLRRLIKWGEMQRNCEREGTCVVSAAKIGEWRAEGGEGRVESGEWRVECGELRVESGEWRVES